MVEVGIQLAKHLNILFQPRCHGLVKQDRRGQRVRLELWRMVELDAKGSRTALAPAWKEAASTGASLLSTRKTFPDGQKFGHFKIENLIIKRLLS